MDSRHLRAASTVMEWSAAGRAAPPHRLFNHQRLGGCATLTSVCWERQPVCVGTCESIVEHCHRQRNSERIRSKNALHQVHDRTACTGNARVGSAAFETISRDNAV